MKIASFFFYLLAVLLVSMLAFRVVETTYGYVVNDQIEGQDSALLEEVAIGVAPMLLVWLLMVIPWWIIKNMYFVAGLGVLLLGVSIFYLIAWWSAIQATGHGQIGFLLLLFSVGSWSLAILLWLLSFGLSKASLQRE